MPGDLPPKNVPMMITITFDDAINNNNINLYKEIFNGKRKNPNGCNIKATVSGNVVGALRMKFSCIEVFLDEGSFNLISKASFSQKSSFEAFLSFVYVKSKACHKYFHGLKL